MGNFQKTGFIMPTCLRSYLLCSLVISALAMTGCMDTYGYSNDYYPNVVDDGGTLSPASGYQWSDPDDGDDYRVYWAPGFEHEDHANVLSDDEPDTWVTAPGYRWVDPNDNDDLRVRWTPGTIHEDFPNVVANAEPNQWQPAPGFTWISSDPGGTGDWRVVPIE